MVDLENLQPVANRVIDQALTTGVASLSERDRVFFLLWSYPAAIDDGGFPSFFYNSFADHYSETLDALRKVGLADHGELLEHAAAALFVSGMPRTTEARNTAMEKLPADVATDKEFDDLYDAYTACGRGDRVLQTLQAWYFQPE